MSRPTVQVSTNINASPSEVWAALTTPELIKSYFFGTDIDTDWHQGSPIRFHGQWKGKAYEDKGEIKAFEPEKKLSYSHFSALSGVADKPENYHLVTFDLARAEGGTKVTLTQENLTDTATKTDPAKKQEFEKNWRMVLDGLKRVVES
jgi:uncharacterized protein YndB with AHSA1/START domain